MKSLLSINLFLEEVFRILRNLYDLKQVVKN